MNTKQQTLGILVLVLSLALSCRGSGQISEPTFTPIATTPLLATMTPTAVQPATTVLPPTYTPLPKAGIVLVSPQAMNVISSWDSSIQAFTPANNPVTNLIGLTSSDVGFWNNSQLGSELYNEVIRLLNNLGPPWEDGLYACPQVNEAFSSCSLRIYFTDNSITDVDGGVRVIFQSDQLSLPPSTPIEQIFHDDFTENIQSGWEWQNEDPTRWAITPDGWLQILGEDASLLANGTQSNLVCRNAPDGDFQITAYQFGIDRYFNTLRGCPHTGAIAEGIVRVDGKAL